MLCFRSVCSPACTVRGARLAVCNPAGLEAVLPGPTGERNVYRVQARQRVLCQAGAHAGAADDLLSQIAAVLAVGGHALLHARFASLHAQLPAAVQASVVLLAAQDVHRAEAALIHADASEVLTLTQQLAMQAGPIISLTALAPGRVDVPLARLVTERSVSTNTAAAGGNASLMTLQA